MSTWGTKRRNTIIFIILAFFLIIAGIISFALFYEEPTCFDGKRNGNEIGIDCGGSCELLCELQIIEPLVHWTRYFEVVPGVYNVLAYLENPNVTDGADRVDYIFKLFDIFNGSLF